MWLCSVGGAVHVRYVPPCPHGDGTPFFLHSGLGTLCGLIHDLESPDRGISGICGGDGRQMALYLAQSPGAGRSGADDVLPGRRADGDPASRRTCGCSDWAYSCCSPVRPVPALPFTGSPGQPTIPGPPPCGWDSCACTAVWRKRKTKRRPAGAGGRPCWFWDSWRA